MRRAASNGGEPGPRAVRGGVRLSRRRRALPAHAARARGGGGAGVHPPRCARARHIWFDSVARHARWHGISVLTPDDPNAPKSSSRCVRCSRISCSRSTIARCSAPSCWRCPTRGAYNMHGSLLPKYRGRAPVNWAVLHGERETGATLHAMVAQARRRRHRGAARRCRSCRTTPRSKCFARSRWRLSWRCIAALPALIAGTRAASPQDLAAGSYFGRRTRARRRDRLAPRRARGA